MSSQLGVSEEKILALPDYATSPLYDDTERVALEYADAMTITGRDVSDDLFARLSAVYDDDAIVELTAVIAWEILQANSTARCACHRKACGSAMPQWQRIANRGI